MTGWWQVRGRGDTPIEIKTRDDLCYMKNYSFWLDLYILWRTVGAVIKGRGAY
jgi:lipopolysaccharide/colanic/teichoic acid biosynthesis glycosyltransferase